MVVKTHTWLLAGAAAVLLGVILSCSRIGTRSEESVYLSHSRDGWQFTWSTLLRRGVNLIDSSGNVGSASAAWKCQSTEPPLTWVIDSEPTSWREHGDAKGMLGPRPHGHWRGEITLRDERGARILLIKLTGPQGQSFIGRTRYAHVYGNGESWFAN